MVDLKPPPEYMFIVRSPLKAQIVTYSAKPAEKEKQVVAVHLLFLEMPLSRIALTEHWPPRSITWTVHIPAEIRIQMDAGIRSNVTSG